MVRYGGGGVIGRLVYKLLIMEVIRKIIEWKHKVERIGVSRSFCNGQINSKKKKVI